MAALELTVGQALARFLIAQRTERDGLEHRLIGRGCGIFGHGNLGGLGDGFAAVERDLPFFQPFHEQSMVHSAVAYARVKRRLSTFACTASIGPGTANLYTGAAGATVQRVPVLLLASDHYATRRQGVVLQQLESPQYDLSVSDGLRGVSVFYDKITRPEQLGPSLLEAARVLTSPSETGAVTLSICQDTQTERGYFPEELFQPRLWHVERRAVEEAQLHRAVALIRAAKQPIIISGGGVYYSEAEAALLSFATEFGIPVVETVAGRSTMPGEEALALGALGIAGSQAANRMAADADLVLAIGTRMTDVTTCSHTLFQNPDVRFITINITGRDTIKLGATPIVADAREGIVALHKALSATGYSVSDSWTEVARTARRDWEAQAAPTLVPPEKGMLTQSQALSIVNAATAENSYVVSAAGSLPGDVAKLWNTAGKKRTHLEFGFSCMTYEIPAGVGIAMAGEPNVTVVIGDGTYLMNSSDLIVAAREQLDLTVCIFVNHGYQIIRDLQRLTTGEPHHTEFRDKANGDYLSLDLAANAASLGAKTFAAQDADSLRQALADAAEIKGLKVITIEVEPHQMSVGTKQAFWDIAPPEVSENQVTRGIRTDYEARRAALQRPYY